jgi:SAM-dependent methyltransferase
MPGDETWIGERKADFNQVYDRPDPRAYLHTMSGLDYRIPQLAVPVFDAVLDAVPTAGGGRTILDVCCSYGINAAALRCRVSMGELTARYHDPALAALPAAELIEADREYFGARPRRPELRVLGLDISAPAIDYAVRTGLLADGWAENLETDEPSEGLTTGLHDVDLIISTGGVGYVGHRTFNRLLAAVARPRQLWAVIFVLRMFDYAEIADSFAEYGLVTERVPGLTLRQRRFVDRDEYESANHDVTLRGLDPTGHESEGWYYADCFLTRPPAAATTPVTELFGEHTG